MRPSYDTCYSKYVQIFTKLKTEIGMDITTYWNYMKTDKEKYISVNKLHEWLQEIQVVITRKLTTGCNFHPVVSEVIKIFSLPLANIHT